MVLEAAVACFTKAVVSALLLAFGGSVDCALDLLSVARLCDLRVTGTASCVLWLGATDFDKFAFSLLVCFVFVEGRPRGFECGAAAGMAGSAGAAV